MEDSNGQLAPIRPMLEEAVQEGIAEATQREEKAKRPRLVLKKKYRRKKQNA